MTLNLVIAVILRYFTFGANYVKVVELIDQYRLQQKRRPKNPVFSNT